MARALKTYVTPAGFFELAVAAPSMKAALEAWGAERNLFNQGFAKETADRAIVAATMAKPGVVLKRAIGSRGAFGETATLPKSLPAEPPKTKPAPKIKAKPAKEKPTKKADDATRRKAQAAFAKAQQRREADRRREAVAQEKAQVARENRIAKAQAALTAAEAHHDKALSDIETARATLDKRVEAEDARWEKQKDALKESLRRARE